MLRVTARVIPCRDTPRLPRHELHRSHASAVRLHPNLCHLMIALKPCTLCLRGFLSPYDACYNLVAPSQTAHSLLVIPVPDISPDSPGRRPHQVAPEFASVSILLSFSISAFAAPTPAQRS